MRKILIVALCAPLLAHAAETTYQEGKIQLCKYVHETGNRCEKVKLRAGESVKFKINVAHEDFLGAPVINANANIDNITNGKLKGVYHISFYNSKGELIGAHEGSWDLSPQQDINYASALIYASEAKIEEVTYFKLRTYALPLLDKKEARIQTVVKKPNAVVRADEIFETGILKDEQGHVDKKTGSKVGVVMNMMGTTNPQTGKTEWAQRYVIVFVPVEKSRIHKIAVETVEGEPIEMVSPAQLFENNDQKHKTGVKLYLMKKAGFDFRLKLNTSK